MSFFPTTKRSLLDDLRSDDAGRRDSGWQSLASAYWKPVYKYVRLRWRKDASDAEDLTQAFFVHALDRDVLAQFDGGRARFRTFLRNCLDRFAIDEHRRANAKRRGGGTVRLDADFASAEHELAEQGLVVDVEAAFDAEWRRHLVAMAIDRLDAGLTARKKPLHGKLFRMFHLDEPPSYAEAAAQLGISTSDVTNWLAVARKEFRRVSLALLREITTTEHDFVEEAREVFGIDVRNPQKD